MEVRRVAHIWPDFVTESGMLSFEGKDGGWKGGTDFVTKSGMLSFEGKGGG